MLSAWRHGPGTWSIAALFLLLSTWPASGGESLPTRSIAVPGGTLEVELAAEDLAIGRAALVEWIERSARAVTSYYGSFPVPRVRLVLASRPGRGVRHGAAQGGPVPEVRIQLGVDSTRADLDRDWVLVHELVHLGFPSVERRHHWMEEGLATYLEPVARARAGLLSPAVVWTDLVQGLPKGLPASGDEGLDRTPTWGRTYCGGALFWLLADVELRERSGGRVGLEVALRAIVRRGGTIGRLWTVEEVIVVGDEATGQTVLRELYDRLALAPTSIDLEDLWRRLGVEPDRGAATFDDAAQLASVRHAITSR